MESMGTEIVHQHSLKYLLYSVEDKINFSNQMDDFLRPTQIRLMPCVPTEQSHTILKYFLIKQAKSIMKVKQVWVNIMTLKNYKIILISHDKPSSIVCVRASYRSGQSRNCPVCRIQVTAANESWVMSDAPTEEDIAGYILNLADEAGHPHRP